MLRTASFRHRLAQALVEAALVLAVSWSLAAPLKGQLTLRMQIEQLERVRQSLIQQPQLDALHTDGFTHVVPFYFFYCCP